MTRLPMDSDAGTPTPLRLGTSDPARHLRAYARATAADGGARMAWQRLQGELCRPAPPARWSHRGLLLGGALMALVGMSAPLRSLSGRAVAPRARTQTTTAAAGFG